MDLTLTSYLFYGAMAPTTCIAVVSYLIVRWNSLEWPTRLFTIFAALNFASDGMSKGWFAAWRLLGKPPSMVDHWLVELVTFTAAFAAMGAFWFWARRSLGDRKPLCIGIGLFAAAAVAPVVLV